MARPSAQAPAVGFREVQNGIPGAQTVIVDRAPPAIVSIDVEAERSRLQKQQDKLAVDRERAAQKLQNESFVNRAPADVVAKERQRLEELEGALSELRERLQKLDTLRAASTD